MKNKNSNKGNEHYREIKHPSVIPYYVIAVSWLLFALFFPMYKLGHFIVITIISIAEFTILRYLIPPRIERIPLPYKAPRSGVSDVDSTIESGAEYIRKFDKISVELAGIDTSLAISLTEIRDLMNNLFEHIAKYPEKLPRIRRFMTYYLPTLEKLMNTYVELSAEKIKGENIKKTLTEIEGILGSLRPAFERFLNDLYEDRAIDISSDITVLENMLEREGMSDFN